MGNEGDHQDRGTGPCNHLAAGDEVNIVHELGEAWEMFKGEDRLIAQLHHTVGRQDQAHAALAKAAKAASEATISADALENDFNDPTDRHAADKANEKALRALQTAYDEISEARHSSQKIDASRVVKQRAAQIVRTVMDGLKALQLKASTPATLPEAPEGAKQDAEVVNADAEDAEVVNADAEDAEVVNADAEDSDTVGDARAEVNAMVRAAKEETSKREHEAASDIQQVEKSAAKRLQSEVQQVTDSIDDRIRTQVRQAESHIEVNFEQQIADEIAVNQVEALFDQSSQVVAQTDDKPDRADDEAAEVANAEDEVKQGAAAEQVDRISDATNIDTKESDSNKHTAKAEDQSEGQDIAKNSAKDQNEKNDAPTIATAQASDNKPWYLHAP